MRSLIKMVTVKRMTGFALIATFACSVAQADLADTMKAMNSDLKAISAQVGDASKNQSSAALADDFAQVAATAKTFVADTIAQAPAAQQAQMKAQFDSLIDESVSLGTQLAAALLAGDNAQAKAILTQLAALKSKGHDQFKN